MTRYTVDLTDDQAREFVTTDYPMPARSAGQLAVARLRAAIRANPPKPPRMPEPGWGEKVIAHTNDSPERREFLRYANHALGGTWIERHGGAVWRWDDLIDPEPLP